MVPFLGGLITTGAGLLADGVSNLFSGKTKAERKAKRQAKKEARQEKRAGKKAAKQEEKLEKWESLGQGVGSTLMGGYTGDVVEGDETETAKTGTRQVGTGKTGDFLKDNWMWIALGVLILFGGKLLKPKRRYRRRRPAARSRTVTRYRTRSRAPARRSTSRRSPARRRRR